MSDAAGRRRPVPALLVALTLILGGPAVRAQRKAQVPEYTAKAGFLTTFTQYTNWPADTFVSDSSPIVIGVLGGDPFGDVLARTAAATQGSRRLQVRRIRTPKEAEGCQVVFIAKSESRYEAEWLASLRSKPVLTVGESDETIARGGILAFVTVGERVGFEASLPAMEQASLRLSSDLLTHAKKVYR